MARKDYNRWARERRILGYRPDSPGDSWNCEYDREQAINQRIEDARLALRASQSASFSASEREQRVESALRKAGRPVGLNVLAASCQLTTQHTVDALTELMDAGKVARVVARQNAIRFALVRP